MNGQCTSLELIIDASDFSTLARSLVNSHASLNTVITLCCIHSHGKGTTIILNTCIGCAYFFQSIGKHANTLILGQANRKVFSPFAVALVFKTHNTHNVSCLTSNSLQIRHSTIIRSAHLLTRLCGLLQLESLSRCEGISIFNSILFGNGKSTIAIICNRSGGANICKRCGCADGEHHGGSQNAREEFLQFHCYSSLVRNSSYSCATAQTPRFTGRMPAASSGFRGITNCVAAVV